MNTARVIALLSARNLRHRPGSAALLLVAISTASLTLALALTIGTGARSRWDETFAHTDGAQIVATADTIDALTPLASATGVAAAIGPFPVVEVPAEIDGQVVRLRMVGRDTLATRIDHPLLTAGSGDLSGSAIVLDHNVATAVHAHIGDPVHVGDRTLTLRGTAISAAQVPFPYQGPGLAWVGRGNAELLGSAVRGQPGARPAYQVELRLTATTDAARFAAAQHVDPTRVRLDTWLSIRDNATAYLRVLGSLLLTVGGLLALLAGCGVTVQVATQMGARLRQVGMLKAIGATPGQVVAATLAEYLAVALLAVALGLVVGVPLAGSFGRRASASLGLPDASGLSWRGGLAVAAVAMLAVLLAGSRPAWRATWGTTDGLGSQVRPPRRPSRLARLAAIGHLPLPAVVGLRSMARRPARTALTAGSCAVAVAMGTVALILRAAAHRFLAASPEPGDTIVNQANRALLGQLQTMITLFTALFIVLGVVNLLLVSTATAHEAATSQAALRAMGFTPGQAVTSLITTQVGTAALGIAAGIPLGTLLFRAFASGNGTLDPGTPTSLGVAGTILLTVATVIASGLLAAFPARALARRPVADLLRSV